MLFPLKIALFLRETALFYTNFNHKFSSLWSKVEGHNILLSIPNFCQKTTYQLWGYISRMVKSRFPGALISVLKPPLLLPPHRALERGQFRNFFFADFFAFFDWYQIFRCVRTGFTRHKSTITKNKLNIKILRK